MDISLVFAILFVVLLVYLLVQCHCAEGFTDALSMKVTPTSSCPNGGNVDDKKLCSDRVQGTYGCGVGYTQLYDGFCHNHENSSIHVPGYQCPSKYKYDDGSNNGTCVRSYGKPTLSCPQGYSLITIPNKGYICNKTI